MYLQASSECVKIVQGINNEENGKEMIYEQKILAK